MGVIGRLIEYARLPRAAKEQVRKDRRSLGPEVDRAEAVRAVIRWLELAQDMSTTKDGGVARHYSLVDGWSESYPETTGYIVPTFLDCADRGLGDRLENRARQMLDWLVRIQMPGGGIQGGTITAQPVVPVTFNTGQVLIGLAAGAARFGEPYRQAMAAAADWLADSQDPDGCWRRFPTPFARLGEKTYETHVTWGLLEACRVERVAAWELAAERNLQWALTKQTSNGWFRDCCLNDPSAPLTHTLGYALRGLIEGYRYFGARDLLQAVERSLTAIGGVIAADGFLAGRLRSDWSPAVRWACLTGHCQLAACFIDAFHFTGDHAYLSSGSRLLSFVRRTIAVEGQEPWVGGVRGSFPVDGRYGRFQFLNWAAKFFVDAQLKEMDALDG